MSTQPSAAQSIRAFLARYFDFRFGRAELTRPSVLALLLANIFPLIGVVALGWNTFLVLALFWAENVVIGVYAAVKMLLVSSATVSARLSAAIFFCVHYGLFAVGHGLFVYFVFGSFIDSSPEGTSAWQTVLSSEMMWGVLVLMVSHGFSFVYNYVRGGEYRRTNLNAEMQQPYGRVVLLHVTIIFGGFLVMLFGSPVVGLVLLVALKTVIDLRAHLRQHDKYASGTPTPA